MGIPRVLNILTAVHGGSQLYRINKTPIQLESRMNQNLWFSKVYETHLQEYMEFWSSQIRE